MIALRHRTDQPEIPRFRPHTGTLAVMSTVSKQHSRADRLREYATTVEVAAIPVAAMGVLVRAREARAWTAELPPEVVFAATTVGERALPASVWVALRRDDVDGAVEAMIGASHTPFLVESREEMGEGYRLQTVEETRPLPEVELLFGQLSTMLDIPVDVLAMVGEWGADDPRTAREIADLLDRRLGPDDAVRAHVGAGAVTEMSADVHAGRPEPQPTPDEGTAPRHAGPDMSGLVMSVADAVAVLRLSEEQARALATLVRRVPVTLTS